MKLLRKIPALLLAVVMLIAAVPVSRAEGLPFRDVRESDWFYSYVKYVYDNGYMVGVTGKTFEPESKLTRAMLVTILCKLSDGAPEVSDDFTDVPAGEWYAPYVGWAAKTGVVKGYGGGIFKPENNITREEMATAMVRYIEYAGVRLPRRSTAPFEFADAGKISDWAASYVETLRRAGIMNGDTTGKYHPASDITRAEIATVIKNYRDAAALAWQGYVPDPERDGFAVYGAKFLWANGFALQGRLLTEMCDFSGYPALRAYPMTDEYSVMTALDLLSYEPEMTIGFSPTAVIADLGKTPIVKVCYSYDGTAVPDGLPAYLSVRHTGEWTYETADVSFERGADDEGAVTATADLSDILASNPNYEFGTETGKNVHLIFRPYDADVPTDSFRLRYVALFSDRESAESFKSADAADYLNGYFISNAARIEKATDTTVSDLDATLRRRISEIKNSESLITPESIEAAGGKCYYVSSLHGDDKNDGLSPETPFRTVSALYKYYPSTNFYMSKARIGDGVFFERGSEFYPSRYYNNTISSLPTSQGVSYGAYGTGPKPVFYGSFDFGGGTGHWEKTEWENVYVIDLHEYVSRDLDDEARINHFSGKAGEIGGIVFNEGQYYGVHIIPTDVGDEDDDSSQGEPFGEDKTTRSKGWQGNCDENFISGGTTCRDPGDALRHNLEYIHSFPEGKVYLRCDWGSPSEVFDRIDLCRQCNICYGEKDVNLDNLAFLYSGYICADIGVGGGKVTYCEAGYAGGNWRSVGTGIGGFGGCESIFINNCYVHDIEDGPIGTQYTGDEEGVELNNVVCTDNVITTSSDLIELFSTKRVAGEDGLGKNKIRNAVVANNIAAYIGYGYPRTVEWADGLAVHNWFYGEMVDCRLYNNIIYCSNGAIIGAHVASDGNPRGWYMYNNTYVLDPALCAFLRGTDGVTFTNLNKSFYAAYAMPFEERYLAYLASVGIDTGSTFMILDGSTQAEFDGYCITTGYYLERGLTPKAMH